MMTLCYHDSLTPNPDFYGVFAVFTDINGAVSNLYSSFVISLNYCYHIFTQHIHAHRILCPWNLSQPQGEDQKKINCFHQFNNLSCFKKLWVISYGLWMMKDWSLRIESFPHFPISTFSNFLLRRSTPSKSYITGLQGSKKPAFVYWKRSISVVRLCLFSLLNESPVYGKRNAILLL